jgi:NAD(P)-dependent dehydrogenase (short-subunit alcohol dehydrogenase family)
MSTWFITGASRGLGLQLARAAVAGGDAVVAAARNPNGLRPGSSHSAGDSLNDKKSCSQVDRTNTPQPYQYRRGEGRRTARDPPTTVRPRQALANGAAAESSLGCRRQAEISAIG